MKGELIFEKSNINELAEVPVYVKAEPMFAEEQIVNMK